VRELERAGTRAWGDRTRGDGFRRKEGRFRLDIRREFFTLRVLRPWPTLPREALAAPPWQCSRPGWMELGPPWAGGRGPCPWQGGLD